MKVLSCMMTSCVISTFCVLAYAVHACLKSDRKLQLKLNVRSEDTKCSATVIGKANVGHTITSGHAGL